MTQRTRYFLVGSALVVMIGLCTGLVAYYNNTPANLAKSNPIELAYLPADSTAVAYADVHAIMNSDFSQRIRATLPTGDGKAELQQELGLDLERDIDSVVAGFVGANPAAEAAVVIVRGRFDQAKIEATATQHGATLEDYKGKKLIIMAGDNAGGPDHKAGGVAFLENGVLALGEVASVRRAVDAGQSRENVMQNADLMKFIGETASAGGNAWVVGRLDALEQTTGLPDQIAQQLPKVQWVAATAHVNGGVAGTMRAEARDEQAAKDLEEIVRGAVAAARMFTGQDPRLQKLAESLQVGRTGKTVKMDFTLPAEVLDFINGVAGLQQLQNARPPAPSGK